jgi:hypothetical protein
LSVFSFVVVVACSPIVLCRVVARRAQRSLVADHAHLLVSRGVEERWITTDYDDERSGSSARTRQRDAHRT